MPPKKDLASKIAEIKLKSKISDEKVKSKEKKETQQGARPPTEKEQKAATTIQKAFRAKKRAESEDGKITKGFNSFVKHMAKESLQKEKTAHHPAGPMAHMEHNFSMAERAIEVMDRHRDNIPTFKYKEHNDFWDEQKKGIKKASEPILVKHFNFYKHFTDYKSKIPDSSEPKFVKEVLERSYFLQDPRANIKIKYIASEPSDLEVMKEVLNRPGAEGVPYNSMKSGKK